MQITISPALNQPGYCVTAELTCGLAHDFFSTQAEAIAFALGFYGGKIQPTKTGV